MNFFIWLINTIYNLFLLILKPFPPLHRLGVAIGKKTERFFTHIPVKNFLILCVGFFVFCGAFFLFWISTFTLPTLDTFEVRKVQQSTKIYDRTGEILLYDVHQDIRRTVIPFDQMSPYIKQATISIEDRDFYNHKGIKPSAILRAVFVNITEGSYSQGGSTITQQVIKNALLTREKTITRKVKEWVLALKLEKIMTKDAILHSYLNEIPYGGAIYGIEEASQSFFAKPARDLTLPEAAHLAALPQAPTYFSPYGNHTDDLENRKNLVLKNMYEIGYITKDEYEKAKAEKVVFKTREERNIKAPHFVMYVKEILVEKYGEEMVEQGGLRVTTSLDYKLQEKAEEIAKRWATSNEQKFNAENASIVAIDAKTGHILTLVGSRDYFDENIQGNFNIATAERQPGSSFKPIVYAQAFTEGYTPETVVFDVPTQFSTYCSSGGNCYSPQNYDEKFRGPVTLRNALAQSLNVPAVKTLYLAGLKDSVNLARDMGITTLTDPDRYGLTLVLGGGEVSLLDMTSAYTVFANNGERNPYVGIVKVEDRDGRVLEEFVPSPVRVLREDVAHQVTSILSDNVARTPLYGTNSPLYFPGREVAAKTGTTNDYKDTWILGYTPQVAVGAWAGNNDNSPMEKNAAGYIVAPMWNEFMNEVLKELPYESFPPPPPIDYTLKPILRGVWQGGNSYAINRETGEPATNETPPELIEERVNNNVHSILYWLDTDNPRGPIPSNPSADPQFSLWESPVREWMGTNGYSDNGSTVITSYQPPPTGGNTNDENNGVIVNIREPDNNDKFELTDTVTVVIRGDAEAGVDRGEVYVNNEMIGSIMETFTFIPGQVRNIQENNELRVIIYDNDGNRKEDKITFKVKGL